MSAQLEDGYTRVANELLEQIPFYKFNGTQFSMLIVIIRFTYGFNRKDHDISLTFLANATGVKRNQADRELSVLIDKKVVLVHKEATRTESRKLGLNKHYEQWNVDRRCPLIRGQSPKKSIPELEDRESPNQSTLGVPYLEDKEIKSFKENLKDTQEEEPKTALSAYLFSFKKFQYTGHIQKYVIELMDRGFTDTFIREVFMEMGARGIGADERYMRKMAEDWIVRGIYTRVQAGQAKEQSTRNNTVSFQQPKKTGIPDMAETQAHLEEMTRLQEAKRKRIAERATS